ncbi:MAG: hypothetical protein ACI3VB_02220 [Oscillospiraceae bacterium]
MAGNKNIDIKRDFSIELCDIVYKLRQLEEGRIYEMTGVRADGTLNTNAVELKKMLADLLLKVEGKRPSGEEELASFLE